MKRLIFAGLVMALFSGSAAFAQSKDSYVDDVYYNGSQAQQDAKAEAKAQKKQKAQQQQDQENTEYYNSSTGSNEGYNTDGNAQVYNTSYGAEDEEYIDYDDDSYTSRIRRFYYPMYNVGYWGSVYSPFWYDPFFANPYYSWGGWYTPGFSMGIGWGGGPYWNNCWGMNTWFGYGGFGSWYYPYGGYGWGYGNGYWNGYYAGLYDAGRYNNGYGRGAVNYGPRGARNGSMSLGSYGRNSGMRATNTANVMEPIRGRGPNTISNGMVNRSNNAVNATTTGRAMQVEGQRGNSNSAGAVNRNNAIRLDGNSRVTEIEQQNATGGRPAQQQQTAAPRSRGFLGNVFRGNSENGARQQRSMDAQPQRTQPSRSYNVERSQPSRSYSNPSPSRSFSSPSPSRSFSSPSRSSGGGGGMRMSGGRGR